MTLRKIEKLKAFFRIALQTSMCSSSGGLCQYREYTEGQRPIHADCLGYTTNKWPGKYRKLLENLSRMGRIHQPMDNGSK